jgi:HSP20 family protein
VARIFFDLRDAGQQLHRRLSLLERELVSGDASSTDSPPMDVVETGAGIEVIVDLPGIDAQAVTVSCRDGAIVVSGTKRPTHCHHGQAAFHLAERSFGRFAREVKLGGAFDASRATATLAAGELRIVVPRIEERRGQPIAIRVTTATAGQVER